MNRILIALLMSVMVVGLACTSDKTETNVLSGEKHLTNMVMLTSEGENAEAYFSFDDQKLIYQSRHGKIECDQIFSMNIDGTEKQMLSTGHGKTTCSFFYPDNRSFIYASTHGADTTCPPPPDYSRGYVWPVYAGFDLFLVTPDTPGGTVISPAPGYDAEATLSPDGQKVVFTSQRNGDLDIYTMNTDGSDLRQLTYELGYDGGPFFSWDNKKIVYRSFHPKTMGEIERYQSLLSQELIEPGNFQIWVMDADGSNKKRVTNNSFANFAPFYHPDNKRIIFCSSLNSTDPRRPDFNLWMINEDGSGLEQITFFDGFDGFPMFSRDGKKIVFASNRNNKQPRDTNIFIADWVE